jgi:integrase
MPGTYVGSLRAMCRWAVKEGLLPRDPLARVEMASEAADRRRVRRALTEKEFHRLLVVARSRPLKEALTIRRGPHKDERVARVRPEVGADLEQLGRERELIYTTLVLTGLRKGELTSLKVSDLDLGGDEPAIRIRAANAKARKEQAVPLRPDLAEELKAWVEATGKGGGDRLFRVPVQLVKIFKRDLEAAGIDVEDDRGRVLDVHALRHTTATHLNKGEVAPRTAQAVMRHSTIDLTMNTYTDDRLLDQRSALDALPSMRAPDESQSVAVSVAVKPGSEGLNVADGVSQPAANERVDDAVPRDVKPCRRKRRRPRSTGDNERQGKAGEGTRTLNIQLGRRTT